VTVETHAVDAATLLDLYEQMAIIRRTEQAAHDLFMRGLVKGTTHLAAGQEAVAVGASAALRPDDYVFATYRGHHHAIARGATPEECLAELMSKATGVCKAKGGSMHLTKAERGMLGSYAIVGAHLPMAVGAAWSARLRGTEQVAVAFFGDGATNIGAFHEALNLAAVWRLREQPLHGVHADSERHVGTEPCGGPGGSQRSARSAHRRKRRAGRPRSGDGRGSSRPRR
jgi:acetoin:2,6-dichlorophenolindophenol oxidoreductase subunit alpha